MMFLDFFLRLAKPTPRRLRRRARLMTWYASRLDRRGKYDRAASLRRWAISLQEEADRT